MMKSQKGYAMASVLPGSFKLHAPKYLSAAWAQLKRWYELARQRHLLASLDDATLKDIGISRVDVQAESERPFWDDPLKR